MTMDILQVILTSILSLVALFLLAKLMGIRQISQMSMFDYINGITLGSIAAELATNLEEWERPLTAMIIYGLAAALINWVTCKSLSLRKLFNSSPLILFEHGKLYEKNLASAKMDINEFLTQCRVNGYFDLEQVDTAILETNGQISFLPKAAQRPVTPQDLQMTPDPERPCVTLILDGHLLPENLKFTGNDDTWLKKQLEANHIKLEEVFLGTCNSQNQLCVYPMTGKKMVHQMFE